MTSAVGAAQKEKPMSRGDKGTTKLGYINRKGQILVRDTGEAGTGFNARKYELRCTHCGHHHYGANSGDIWQRKCPKCQGGREGLPLRKGAHA